MRCPMKSVLPMLSSQQCSGEQSIPLDLQLGWGRKRISGQTHHGPIRIPYTLNKDHEPPLESASIFWALLSAWKRLLKSCLCMFQKRRDNRKLIRAMKTHENKKHFSPRFSGMIQAVERGSRNIATKLKTRLIRKELRQRSAKIKALITGML